MLCAESSKSPQAPGVLLLVTEVKIGISCCCCPCLLFYRAFSVVAVHPGLQLVVRQSGLVMGAVLLASSWFFVQLFATEVV